MTITPTQLDEAEAIARAATQGEWYVASDGCVYAGQIPDEYGECHDVLVADMSCDAPWNRRHIAPRGLDRRDVRGRNVSLLRR